MKRCVIDEYIERVRAAKNKEELDIVLKELREFCMSCYEAWEGDIDDLVSAGQEAIGMVEEEAKYWEKKAKR